MHSVFTSKACTNSEHGVKILWNMIQSITEFPSYFLEQTTSLQGKNSQYSRSPDTWGYSVGGVGSGSFLAAKQLSEVPEPGSQLFSVLRCCKSENFSSAWWFGLLSGDTSLSFLWQATWISLWSQLSCMQVGAKKQSPTLIRLFLAVLAIVKHQCYPGALWHWGLYTHKRWQLLT